MRDIIKRLAHREPVEIDWGGTTYTVRFTGTVRSKETDTVSLVFEVNDKVYAVNLDDIRELVRT